MQKTVWGETTTYVHTGAQVIQRTTVPQVLPEAAADDDGDLVAANGTPPGADYLGGGGILADAQQRVNFQPERSAIPEGFVGVDAYGKQTITAGVNGAVRAKSAVGWDRGFTGYIADNETGLLHARARQYDLHPRHPERL